MKILHTFFSLILSDASLFDLHRTSPPSSSSSPSQQQQNGSTQYDLKTWHAGNTIETTIIAILQSSCNELCILVLYLSFSSLLRLFPCCVFLRITFTCIFRVLFCFIFFNLKAQTGISESDQNKVVKLGKSTNLVFICKGSNMDVHFVSYSSFVYMKLPVQIIILSCHLLNPPSFIHL